MEPDYGHLWIRLKDFLLQRSSWETREVISLMEILERDRELTIVNALKGKSPRKEKS